MVVLFAFTITADAFEVNLQSSTLTELLAVSSVRAVESPLCTSTLHKDTFVDPTTLTGATTTISCTETLFAELMTNPPGTMTAAPFPLTFAVTFTALPSVTLYVLPDSSPLASRLSRSDAVTSIAESVSTV